MIMIMINGWLCAHTRRADRRIYETRKEEVWNGI